jgi:hypothetical protein
MHQEDGGFDSKNEARFLETKQILGERRKAKKYFLGHVIDTMSLYLARRSPSKESSHECLESYV